jgi:hypothetical protein
VNKPQTKTLFINYRRTINGNLSSAAHYAKLLHSKLKRRFGEQAVFLDEQSIPEGSVYPNEIEQRLRSATVVLVLIGDDWLEAKGAHNRRRIDEDNDWVRTEIEIAFQSKGPQQIVVILEKVSQTMPAKDAFPKSIANLSSLQFSKLRLETIEQDFEDFANWLVTTHGLRPLQQPTAVTKTRRVFVSLPSDRWLSDADKEVKWAIVSRIESLGFNTEIFLDPRGKSSIAAPMAWNAEGCEHVMRRCEGCVILGFPRWEFSQGKQAVWLPTEYNHYEAAVAKTLAIPLLVLVQQHVERRVVFDSNFHGHIGVIPNPPCVNWLDTDEFTVPFGYWCDQLSARRDIYLGYCHSTAPAAQAIRDFLTDKLGVTVFDGNNDHIPGNTVIDELKDASRRCGAAIFLFPRAAQQSDGYDAGVTTTEKLLFDAGFFIAGKGRDRVLFFLEPKSGQMADSAKKRRSPTLNPH